METFDATIISQYQASPVINQLVANMNTYIDPAASLNAFYADIWNIDTAQGYGLDVWGRIVGVIRLLQVTGGVYFGFAEAADPSGTGFNQAPFYAGAPITSNYALSDVAFRTLILAKALLNITIASIPAINQILLNLFPGRGNCYCTDGEDMTMTYTFAHFSPALSVVERAIVAQSGVLPRPPGVSTSIVTI